MARNSLQVLALAAAALLLGLLLYNTLRLTHGPSENPEPATAPPPSMPEGGKSLLLPQASPSDKEPLFQKLQEDGTAMGLQVVSPDEEDEPPEPFMRSQLSEPGTREQAEAAMRELSSLRQSAERAGGKKPPVPLEGRTPALLSAPGPATSHFLLDSPSPAE